MNIQLYGGIDADTDLLLNECFRTHPAYSAARDHKRFLIVGRKGSGKTAIYRQLITPDSHDRLAFGHSFDDYPWHHHDLQAEIGVPEERRFLHSWSYLINMSLTRVLLNRDQSQPHSDEALDLLEDLERFVVDSYGSREPDVHQLFSPGRRIRLRGKLNLGIVGVDADGVAVTDLPAHIQEVNSVISNAVVAALNPELHYYVCFDQLDLGFEPDNPLYHNRLIGLILAARRLNLQGSDAGKNLTVAIFLRDDIYSILEFEDKNKTTESSLVEVRWTDKVEAGSLTLRELMEKRFAQVLGSTEPVTWEQVFDETKEMPGRQEKYQHICDRTFLRPRDMIKFCNEIAVAQAERLHGGAPRPYENDDLSRARDRYSKYLLRELGDEIHKHVPNYKEYLNVLRRIGSLQFTREKFIEEFELSGALDTTGSTADEALQQLFDFSVIGVRQSGGAAGGSRVQMRYRLDEDRTVDDASRFRVHAGFKEALELIQGER